MTIKGKKYISLKEAAELSGYTQDYLGQLIRGGKLTGKKVYANVAWMTTEEDLRAYTEGVQNGNGHNGNNGNGNGNGKKNGNGNGGRANGRRPVSPAGLTKPALFFFAGFLAAAVFALFYVLAVNVDTKLEQRAVDRVRAEDTNMEQQFIPPEGGFESL